MMQTSTSSDMGTPQRVPVRLTALRYSNLCDVQNSFTTISGQSVGYDSNGDLTSTQAWGTGVSPVSMSYDSPNRLLSAADGTDTVTCTYDTRNRVTSRTINSVTTLFLWDGWDLIEERDLSGNQVRRYVHGAGVDEPSRGIGGEMDVGAAEARRADERVERIRQLLMMVDATGAKYHLLDALGSVTALTDDTGALLESYRYDVFGKPSFFDASGSAQSASSVDNRFLYTGREWIAQASLYDYRNRMYSPAIGRFMQVDPIRFDAGDVNLYRYVGNGVTIRIDPDGRLWWVAAGAIAGAVAGAVYSTVNQSLYGDGPINWNNVLDSAISGAVIGAGTALGGAVMAAGAGGASVGAALGFGLGVDAGTAAIAASAGIAGLSGTAAGFIPPLSEWGEPCP